MNSVERVMAALRSEPVDRVPTFEWLISKKVREKLLPNSDEYTFIEKMGIDAIVVYPDYKKEFVEKDAYLDEWKVLKRTTSEENDMPVDGPVKCEEDLEGYCVPDVNADYRFDTMKSAIERFRGSHAVILHLNDVFSLPSRIMQFEEFLMAMITEPELVEKLISITVDYNIALAERAYKEGLRIVMTGDDFCFAGGSLIPPPIFKSLFHPYYKKVMSAYKDIGLMVIKHCDGDVLQLIDMIMDAPIDCYDPIEPAAGMELAYFKQRYGSKVCLKGNVDCSHLLTFGTVDEVVTVTKETLKIGMPGYGFILSSSNSIHSEVKPENYAAMLETLHEFGVYDK